MRRGNLVAGRYCARLRVRPSVWGACRILGQASDHTFYCPPYLYVRQNDPALFHLITTLADLNNTRDRCVARHHEALRPSALHKSEGIRFAPSRPTDESHTVVLPSRASASLGLSVSYPSSTFNQNTGIATWWHRESAILDLSSRLWAFG